METEKFNTADVMEVNMLLRATAAGSIIQPPPEITMANTLNLDISNLRTELAPLYRQYPGQYQPQPAYVTLENGFVQADWSGDSGGGMPPSVWHHRTLRWAVNPSANGRALAALLEGEALPLLERVHAGHTVEWDGSNNVGLLTADAQDASDELERLLDAMNDPENQTQVWGADEWLFQSSRDLGQHWTDQPILAVAQAIESDARAEGVIINGSISNALLDRAEAVLDAGGSLTPAQHAALVADGRVDA
jgi:hypothetical protein